MSKKDDGGLVRFSPRTSTRRRLWLGIGAWRRRRMFVAQHMIGRTGDSKKAHAL
jgi:hypothetical protein